jgi:vacuolar-type H+-ATPase subunit F/Vma7
MTNATQKKAARAVQRLIDAAKDLVAIEEKAMRELRDDCTRTSRSKARIIPFPTSKKEEASPKDG